MDRKQLKELLDKMGKHIPLCKIELYLGMPKNTLQKALSEKESKPRKLPKKWIIPITEFVNFKKYITMDNSNASKTKEVKKQTDAPTETKDAVNEPPIDPTWKPKTLEELKTKMPPNLEWYEKSTWILIERQKYNL